MSPKTRSSGRAAAQAAAARAEEARAAEKARAAAAALDKVRRAVRKHLVLDAGEASTKAPVKVAKQPLSGIFLNFF